VRLFRLDFSGILTLEPKRSVTADRTDIVPFSDGAWLRRLVIQMLWVERFSFLPDLVAASGNDWKRLEESKFRGIDVPDLKIDRK
jgi:hypothetical protein